MSKFEDELLIDAEHDANAVAYMYAHLPQEAKESLTEELLYYCLDLIETFLGENIDFSEEEVEIDLEEITKYIIQVAHKDNFASLNEDDVYLAVNAYFDFEEEQGNI